jgi:hypothetical protein
MGLNKWFWAIILIALGVVLLLANLGLISDAWTVFWPVAIVLLGVWFLVGAFSWGRRSRNVTTEKVAIPLAGATSARIRVNHGAGRLLVSGHAQPGELVNGEFSGGLDWRFGRRNGELDVRMRVPYQGWSWGWGWGGGGFLDWTYALSSEVPLDLRFETGAGQARIDLSETRTAFLRLDTGASSTEVTLPANGGLTQVRVHAGAASVSIHVPTGVAARIRFRGGLASISVDRNRFPRAHGEYRSPDYDAAANRADIDVEAGMGSVHVY